MSNNDFFDILGELDDELISDSAFPVKPVKKKGAIKTFFLIAACVALFIASGFILTKNIKTGNIGIYEMTIPESTALYIPEGTTKKEELTSLSDADISSTEEQTTSAHIYEPTTEEPVTQKPSTEEAPSENVSDNAFMPPPEETSEEETDTKHGISILPPFLEDILFPSLGVSSLNEPRFVKVPAIAFYENLPEDSFNSDFYSNTEKVPWHTLEEIYGTKLIPTYIPSGTSNPTLDSLPDYEIHHKEYTVYYSEDKSDVFSSQKFVLNTASDTLTVKASTQKFPVYTAEEKYAENSCLIKDVPVLLISGTVLGKPVIFNALFEKDGIYFRITLQGKSLSEEEFIRIIESVI